MSKNRSAGEKVANQDLTPDWGDPGLGVPSGELGLHILREK
jgi:hypothetical protein